MSGKKLIQKLFRRERLIRTNVRPRSGAALDQYDKMNLQEEKIQRSNKAERVLRKVKRRLDRAFGFAVEAKLPPMSSREKVSVARVVYLSGHAIQLTFSNALIIEHEGFLPGDIVVFLNGQLKGKNLAVVNVPNSTHLLLEDVSTFSGTETNITVRININGSKRSYT